VASVGAAVSVSPDCGSTIDQATFSVLLNRNVNALVCMPSASDVGTPESGPMSVPSTVKLFAMPYGASNGSPPLS
jgi:hypothetical protein